MPTSVPNHDGRAAICYVHSRATESCDAAERLAEAFRVTGVPVGRQLTELLAAAQPDALVVDATARDFDATRLCRDVRDSVRLPIVALVDAPSDEQVVELLDAGAAEVVGVDASAALLHAHVRAALRSAPPLPRPARLTVGDVLIDVDAHVLYIGDEVVECPPLLFSLLVALASSPNTVATRESLLSQVWGLEPGTVDTRRVRVAASLLRRLLGAGPRRPRIETVSRIGYRLAVDS